MRHDERIKAGGRVAVNEGAYLKKWAHGQMPHSHLALSHGLRGEGFRRPEMKGSYPFSCFLLLSFGAWLPPGHGQKLTYPGEEMDAPREQPSLWFMEASKPRRSAEDLGSLSSIAKELRGFGKERAGIRFRFGRQQEGLEAENEANNYLPEEDGGEKQGDTLGSLAEELNGYNRKKGGFSFRFGRGRRGAPF